MATFERLIELQQDIIDTIQNRGELSASVALGLDTNGFIPQDYKDEHRVGFGVGATAGAGWLDQLVKDVAAGTVPFEADLISAINARIAGITQEAESKGGLQSEAGNESDLESPNPVHIARRALQAGREADAIRKRRAEYAAEIEVINAFLNRADAALESLRGKTTDELPEFNITSKAELEFLREKLRGIEQDIQDIEVTDANIFLDPGEEGNPFDRLIPILKRAEDLSLDAGDGDEANKGGGGNTPNRDQVILDAGVDLFNLVQGVKPTGANADQEMVDKAITSLNAIAKRSQLNLALFSITEEDIRSVIGDGYRVQGISSDIIQRALAGEFEQGSVDDAIRGGAQQLAMQMFVTAVDALTAAQKLDLNVDQLITKARTAWTSAVTQLRESVAVDERGLYDGLVASTDDLFVIATQRGGIIGATDLDIETALGRQGQVPLAVVGTSGLVDETGQTISQREADTRRANGLPVYKDGQLLSGSNPANPIVVATDGAVKTISDGILSGEVTFEEAMDMFGAIVQAGEALIGPNGFMDIGIDTASLITELANAVVGGENPDGTTRRMTVQEAKDTLNGIIDTANEARAKELEQERFDQEQRIGARAEIQRRREERDIRLTDLENEERDFLQSNFESLITNPNLPPSTPGAIVGGSDVIADLARKTKARVVAEPSAIGGPVLLPGRGGSTFDEARRRALAAIPETTVEELLA